MMCLGLEFFFPGEPGTFTYVAFALRQFAIRNSNSEIDSSRSACISRPALSDDEGRALSRVEGKVEPGFCAQGAQKPNW